MEQVLLKSRIGPITITRRPLDEHGNPQKLVYEWSFDNDFRCPVPLTWWNEVEGTALDKNYMYSEAFQPLQRISQ